MAVFAVFASQWVRAAPVITVGRANGSSFAGYTGAKYPTKVIVSSNLKFFGGAGSGYSSVCAPCILESTTPLPIGLLRLLVGGRSLQSHSQALQSRPQHEGPKRCPTALCQPNVLKVILCVPSVAKSASQRWSEILLS